GIKLNSGGSAGNGSGFGGQMAQLPNGVAYVEPPTQTATVSYQALLKAENEHIAAVKSCPLQS
ncbi:hypothetical protein HCZ28_20050, partial [Vibrio diazotrophicus]|nr:hypothetical protein [Vibrio diazotrophicus]